MWYIRCIYSQYLLAFCRSSNKTNDDIVLELVSDTLKYLPQRIDSTSEGMTAAALDPRQFRSLTPDPLRKMMQERASKNPLIDYPDPSVYVTVLRQEINRFDRLLGIIHSSLSSLRLAVKGEVLMSEQLDEAYSALLSNRVPKAWEVIPEITFLFIVIIIWNLETCPNIAAQTLAPETLHDAKTSSQLSFSQMLTMWILGVSFRCLVQSLEIVAFLHDVTSAILVSQTNLGVEPFSDVGLSFVPIILQSWWPLKWKNSEALNYKNIHAYILYLSRIRKAAIGWCGPN